MPVECGPARRHVQDTYFIHTSRNTPLLHIVCCLIGQTRADGVGLWFGLCSINIAICVSAYQCASSPFMHSKVPSKIEYGTRHNEGVGSSLSFYFQSYDNENKCYISYQKGLWNRGLHLTDVPQGGCVRGSLMWNKMTTCLLFPLLSCFHLSLSLLYSSTSLSISPSHFITFISLCSCHSVRWWHHPSDTRQDEPASGEGAGQGEGKGGRPPDTQQGACCHPLHHKSRDQLQSW